MLKAPESNDPTETQFPGQCRPNLSIVDKNTLSKVDKNTLSIVDKNTFGTKQMHIDISCNHRRKNWYVGVTTSPRPKYLFYQKNLCLCHNTITKGWFTSLITMVATITDHHNLQNHCWHSKSQAQLSLPQDPRQKPQAPGPQAPRCSLHHSAPLLFLHHPLPVQICRSTVPKVHHTPVDACS